MTTDIKPSAMKKMIRWERYCDQRNESAKDYWFYGRVMYKGNQIENASKLADEIKIYLMENPDSKIGIAFDGANGKKLKKEALRVFFRAIYQEWKDNRAFVYTWHMSPGVRDDFRSINYELEKELRNDYA